MSTKGQIKIFFIFCLLLSYPFKLWSQCDSTNMELPKDSILLKKYFRVECSRRCNISSIDWNNWFDCYDMTLESDSLPLNTHIDFIIRRFLSPGVKSLIGDIHKIKSILIQSYPYKFSQTHKGVNIEISYVNQNAISHQAKRSLKSERRKIKAEYKIPNLKNAILITVFYQNTWQRWIVFENGKSLLWHFNGTSVLDLNPELLEIEELYGLRECYKVIDPDGKIETPFK